jgi:Uma2 family endonuclease
MPRVSAPLNIGRDTDDARVPDVGVFSEGTPRTSPAFLASAALVVEVLSKEAAGAKLDPYARWGVEEYLEIDLVRRTQRLLRREGERWGRTTESAVLGFRLEGDALVTATERYRIDWPDEA